MADESSRTDLRESGTAARWRVYTGHMRLVLLSSVVVVGLAVLAPTAVPKDGVRAIADGPVRLAAPPGAKLRVSWRLIDGDGRRFGASGIYLRVSRCGHKPLLIPARERRDGRYTARFTVPRGGIRKLMVGLEGWRTSEGRTERADAIFNFAPALGRRCS